MTLTDPFVQSDTSVVDRAVVLERMGGDEELMREIIGIFLEEYPSLLEGIHDAVRKQDGRALECFAHNLKGSVSNFGAPLATQAALELEQMGRKGDIQRAPAAAALLERELSSVRSALQSL